MTHSNKAIRGIVLVALAAMLWGTTGTAQSFANTSLSPYWVGTLRLAIASLFFIVYIYFSLGINKTLQNLQQINWRHAITAGFCMAIYNMAFFAGVKATGVAIGTALAIGSGPIWAGILQIIMRIVPSKTWWIGTILAVCGGVLLAISQDADLKIDALGIGLCLLAGFSYAAYAILNKGLVSHTHPAVTTFAIFTTGACIAIPAAFVVAGSLQIQANDWLIVGFLGLVSTGVAYLLFSNGLRTISAASGVSLALIEPVTAFILAILVVGERPLFSAYLGMVILLIGLAVVIRSETKTQN